MNRADADHYIGSVSKGNGKMGIPVYGLPVSTCTKHAPLDECSTCCKTNCYAQRNKYNFPNVKAAQENRLTRINGDPGWVSAAFEWHFQRSDYFRLWDSGDFPNATVMDSIVRAAEAAEDRCRIYAPTKRYDLLKAGYDIPRPANLCIRVGLWKIDPSPLEVQNYITTFGNVSIVLKDKHDLTWNGEPIHVCAAPHKATCTVDCDVCFRNDVKVVGYPWH